MADDAIVIAMAKNRLLMGLYRNGVNIKLS
jgi:hypothetical protein